MEGPTGPCLDSSCWEGSFPAIAGGNEGDEEASDEGESESDNEQGTDAEDEQAGDEEGATTHTTESGVRYAALRGKASSEEAASESSQVDSAAVDKVALQEPAKKEEGHGNKERARYGDVRVLVAEDNLVNQLVLRRILANLGAQHEVVGDGAQAVKAWSSKHYDLILMVSETELGTLQSG